MITHPAKLLFPADGITKGELAAYYQAVAPVMLGSWSAVHLAMVKSSRGRFCSTPDVAQ